MYAISALRLREAQAGKHLLGLNLTAFDPPLPRKYCFDFGSTLQATIVRVAHGVQKMEMFEESVALTVIESVALMVIELVALAVAIWGLKRFIIVLRKKKRTTEINVIWYAF